MSLILSGSDGLSDVDGSASTPAIRGTDANTGIFFPAADTIAFAEGGTESMRLDSSGNVGIGTSSPSSKLTVGNNPPVAGAIAAVGSSGGISLALSDNVNSSLYVRNASGGAILGTDSGGNLRFATNGNSSTEERMRIDSSGNLFVGTTGAVLTGARATFKATSGAGIVSAVNTNVNLHCVNENNTSWDAISFRYNTSTEVGRVACTSTATSYVTSSDYRLKENVVPLTGALAKVSQLKPSVWTWKSDGSSGQGFIAHELQEICPDAVSGKKDEVDADGNPKYQGVDTSFLVATLAAAIQELKSELDAAKARIAVLEAK